MRKIILSLALIVAACDRDRPPAPTEEQAAHLDEAEAMLNDMAANEEGAAPAGAAPSNSN
jgi:hypothetical protein